MPSREIVPRSGEEQLTATTIFLMATACAFSVAALYYNQPLLPEMAASFGLTGGEAGQIATATQLGYAVGLFFFVPLGDRMDRKRLILTLLCLNMASLTAVGSAPAHGALLAASFAVGTTAVTTQIVIPAVSGLAAPQKRGRVIGALLSGLSTGQLLARTISGVVGAEGRWRLMFLLAVAIDVALMVIIALRLPKTERPAPLPYSALLGSLWSLARSRPVLRAACATGFLMFAAFSALWATLAALLAQAPHGFGPETVGVFGFVGIAGLVASPRIGHAVDRFGARRVLALGALGLVGAFLLVAGSARHLWLLVVAMAMIDVGNRAGLVANQSRIAALEPDARSRVNTLFMTSYFLGGAVGAAVAAQAASRFGWIGLSMTGVGFAAAALVLHAIMGKESTPSDADQPRAAP